MDSFEAYKQMFVRDFRGPFLRQNIGWRWYTCKHRLSDDFLNEHLNGDCWLGAPGMWYPQAAFLDFDFSTQTATYRAETIGRALDLLNISESQYYLMSSPSFAENGSCHLVFLPRYKGQLATLNLVRNHLRKTLGSICEFYPQKRRMFRLPLGKDQFLIDNDGSVLTHQNWETALHYIQKLDNFEIPAPSQNLIYGFGDVPDKVVGKHLPGDSAKILSSLAEAEHLREHGLQAFYSRHFSQLKLAIYLYRKNWIPADAEAEIKSWIRLKHNNFSQEVALGEWGIIDEEIKRIVKWVYNSSDLLPDTVRNLDGELTAGDLKFAAQIYRGSTVKQKRLVDLFSYCRPRRHHDWIFISYKQWARIVNKKHYRKFIHELEEKHIIRADWRYRHNPQNKRDSYCRKFKLLVNLQNDSPIRNDGVNITDFYDAWLNVCGTNVRQAADATGLPTQRFYHHKKPTGKKDE